MNDNLYSMYYYAAALNFSRNLKPLQDVLFSVLASSSHMFEKKY